MDVIKITLFVVVALSSSSAVEGNETCEGINVYNIFDNGASNTVWYAWSWYDDSWHGTSFWGGHLQIPFQDELSDGCFTDWGNFVVLKDRHPDITTVTENIVTLQACIINQARICERNVDVEMRKCGDDLLYRFPWIDNEFTGNDYFCFDQIYDKTCADEETVYFAGNEEGKYVRFTYGDYQVGWFDAFQNGKQFVLPVLEEMDEIHSECFPDGWGYYLKDPIPQLPEGSPTRLTLCDVSRNYYYYDYNESYELYSYCDYFIYVRSCNGKLQFDLSYFRITWDCGDCICLVHDNNVKVSPEIGHELSYVDDGDKSKTVYNPFLQYKCSFDLVSDVFYKVNWYINGTFQVQTGPSNLLDDLVFKEEFLKHLPPGYEVQCGVVKIIGNETIETLSDVFYSGWKTKDNSVTVSKSGYTVIDVEQTIPVGCHYTEDDTTNCVEELTLEDPSYVPDVCTGGLRVQNVDDASKSYVEIQALRNGEGWTSTTHRIRLSTVDSDYDDKTAYDLQMSITESVGHGNKRSITTKPVDTIHVDVTDNNRHWNKRCYSHVDPHMKTTDGIYYEAQKEGDYMMAMNDPFQTQIQESARYCSPGYEHGPVCACGIAIAVGADAFMIDICPESNFTFDYVKCGDGGIIDVEEINGYRYMVRTPIGMIIDIFLHTWSNTMNIDIYMSAKDFGNVVGLCGDFDGDKTNDLLHRDGQTVSDDENRSYQFADSWRLTDEENLFKNKDRYLQPWNVDTGGLASQPCSRSHSITRKKCKISKRKRRSITDKLERDRKPFQALLPRKKRNIMYFTKEEAFIFCNDSIFSTTAVQEFPDKLAGENLDKVVGQCVIDLTRGNDTAWVKAHTIVLNNVADAILKLNPVYVANNTDIVNSFRQQICLNDCSGNGLCTETGVCDCNGTFRGPDCSIDLRIPPVIYGIEGGGICEIDENDDCTCFQIRTNNIFEGFTCDISKFKVYFNGTIVMETNSNHYGDYIDIFTGECCAPVERKRRSDDEDDLFVVMYEFVVSNDGDSYGETNTVLVYDTTCLEQVDINGNITIKLKDGYCFIDSECVVHNTKLLSTDICNLCDPTVNQFNWTTGSCEDDTTGFPQALLIGIIVGSVSLIIIIGLLMYIVYGKKKAVKKNRVIGHSFPNLQTSLANMKLPETLNDKKVLPSIASLGTPNLQTTLANMKLPDTLNGRKVLPCIASLGIDESNDTESITVVPEISVVGAAKPLYTRNRFTLYSTEHVEGEPEISVMKVPNEDDAMGENDGRSQSNIDLEKGDRPVVRTISVASLKIY